MALHDRIRKLTYEDYARIPDDGLRHEIIDGEHYVSPSPKRKHQRLSMVLGSCLHVFVEDHQLGEVYAAPFDVIFSEHDIVQPDLMFIANDRLPVLTEDNVQGAPSLIIEILSKSTRRLDEQLKLDLYDRSGALEYWMLNPFRKSARIFRRSGERLLLVAELSAAARDVLTSPLLPGLEIPLAELFP